MRKTITLRTVRTLLIVLTLMGTAYSTRMTAAENLIVPEGAKLELLYTRTARINGGLTEGPAVAPDGSIYFTDFPVGPDLGMILKAARDMGRVSVSVGPLSSMAYWLLGLSENA